MSANECWLLDHFGQGFSPLALNHSVPAGTGLKTIPLDAPPSSPSAERHLGETENALYLIRPDQHVAARGITATADQIASARAAALKS